MENAVVTLTSVLACINVSPYSTLFQLKDQMTVQQPVKAQFL